MSLSLTVAMVHYGYGKTKFLLDHAQMTTALKYSNFAVLVNGFAMAFLKISVGMSLLRLQLGRGMIWIVWFSIFLSVAVNALTLVTSLFGCRPIAAIWDKSLMPTSTCLPRTVYVANGYIQASKSRTFPSSSTFRTSKLTLVQRATSSRICSTASARFTTSPKSRFRSTTNGPSAAYS